MANSFDIEHKIKISAELAKQKQKQLLAEKRRQLLRQNNHELRELEARLRAAYVYKCLKSQIAEKEAIKYNESLLRKHEDDIIKNSIQEENDILKTQHKEELKKKECLRKDLLDQIALVQQEKSKRYEEFLKEKKLLDEITCKIHEEQLEEMRQELEKKARYKSDIDEFLQLKKAWKQQQQQDMIKENERLQKYFEEKEMYDKEYIEKQRQERIVREEIASRIGQEICRTMVNDYIEIYLFYNFKVITQYFFQKEKLRREEILRELYAAEKEAEEDLKIRKQLEEQLRRRIQLRVDLDKHKKEMDLRKKQEEEEDKMFYEKQLEILAERDKIEQMSNEKRRRKIIEHRKELQKCLEEKKMKRFEEVNELLKEREQEIQEEKTRYVLNRIFPLLSH